VDEASVESGARFFTSTETIIDSSANVRQEEEIVVAHPRLSLDLKQSLKPGYVGLSAARVVELSDNTVILDEKHVPPVLFCAAHATISGWVDRVIGWLDSKLQQLSRYAADPSSGGGLQSSDFLLLQALNRFQPVLVHFSRSRYVHPERLYEELLRLAGELTTFGSSERELRDYGSYDHDDLEEVFEPVLADIQTYLSVQLDLRAIRLELIDRSDEGAFVHPIRDRNIFRTHSLILEVSANVSLSQIQNQVPNFFKVGPKDRMNEIVLHNLPGITLVHRPTPPPPIRVISDHVYFYLDRSSPLWPEFSNAPSLGIHFAGNWPGLELELWAVNEGRR
jgi:type VI secretion system protein ImpJ